MPFTEADVRFEIKELRADMLASLLVAVVFTAWLWFFYAVVSLWEPLTNSIPTLMLLAGALAAWRLGRKRAGIGRWVVLLGAVAAEGVVVWLHPDAMSLSLGTLIILVAEPLLGFGGASVLMLVTASTGLVAFWAATGEATLANPHVAGPLALYALTLGATWVVLRPLEQIMPWALAGWAEARKTLHETRDRRGEIYRVMRALEEASFRIEHMNRALVAARREAELARAQKGHFVATVSHELRGPLNLILGFSKMMVLSPQKYDEPLPISYRRDVDTIYRNSQHLAALVDDVLDLSRIEADALPIVKDRIDLEQDVVAKAASTVQPLAERKGLYVRLDLAGNLPWVLADAVRLRQVLINLLNNAIRFTDTGGIVIRTTQEGTYLRVTVQDTGRGVPPEDLGQLFQEWHAPQGDVRDGSSSGLGLAISNHLVALHGGRLTAESQLGSGSLFSFTVPLPGTVGSSVEVVDTGAPVVQPSSTETCLVVHDDPEVVSLLARHLGGYRVVGLPQDRYLLDLVEELRPRAIVTIPELLESTRQRLAELPYDVPVINCGLPGLRRQDDFASILGYVVKPVTAEALAGVMRQVERTGETRILLADDDVDATRLMENILLALPRTYQIQRACNGTQALDLMQETVPDIAFVDILMPGMDGRELIRRMREDGRLCSVPVVVVSAADWMEDTLSAVTPISLFSKDKLEITHAMRCLNALLDVAKPRYV
jgi:signal transduction histidine kinase/CheY-like chemotaxis protein